MELNKTKLKRDILFITEYQKNLKNYYTESLIAPWDNPDHELIKKLKSELKTKRAILIDIFPEMINYSCPSTGSNSQLKEMDKSLNERISVLKNRLDDIESLKKSVNIKKTIYIMLLLTIIYLSIDALFLKKNIYNPYLHIFNYIDSFSTNSANSAGEIVVGLLTISPIYFLLQKIFK